MTQRIKQFIVTVAIAIIGVAGTTILPSLPAYAGTPTPPPSPADQIKGGSDAAGGGGQKGLAPQIKTVIDILLFIIGAVAVIMIILGGIRYVLSNGDSSQISGAKNTILYAVIGLVVALLAYAIVNFVVAQFV